MENTFENASDYISDLGLVENNWNRAVIATAFISYAAKVKNKNCIIPDVGHNAFHNIAEEFRKWQRQWDLFGKQEISKKPLHLDEFIKELEHKYVVGFKHCS